MTGELLEWYRNYETTNHRKPTRNEMIKYAKKISKNKEFKASKGWLDKFKLRFNLEFKIVKKSNITRKINLEKTEIINSRRIVGINRSGGGIKLRFEFSII